MLWEQSQRVQEAPFGVAKQVGAQEILNCELVSGNIGLCQRFQALELHHSQGLHGPCSWTEAGQ